MNDSLISTIQAFTLNARHRLEQEADEQLQGLCGWLPDGTFARADLYPAIKTVDEARETRARLEQFAAEEKEAGFSAPDARRKLLRETAFTWLNRFVAFRMMEERRIIKQTISKLAGSNAFKLWLVEDANAAAYAEFKKGDMPKNAMDEGPSQTAYRQFLLAQCAGLAADVSVLFDPATLASRLCPRPAVLKELVEAMNAAELVKAWEAGNEETIGWVYQGFNTEEKAATFASFQAGKKITAERIGAATQIFTPRWVVKYLVENSLGRLWLDLHPNSRLGASLGYLVPLKSATQRSLKRVKDIAFMDPCCGSMHFGLMAFDLFVEMYREERENAGKPGWPEKPSASTEEEIPELILAHNLHGIDIDLRAVQVSGLALLLKARTLNPKAAVTDANLACANIQQLTGGRLDAFISATPFSHPIYERVLRRLAFRLKDSDYLGSLLRIEGEIEQLVTAERRQSTDLFEKLPGFDTEQFKTQEGIEEFFGILTDQIGRHLDHFVQASGGGLFAAEAAKGLRFLRLVERRYDVVATNPPYLDSRDYSAVHKAYLEDQFPSSKRNLFAAFIQRCLELADPEGLVGMITGQSFMFISSYEALRENLLEGGAIQTLAQFDYHLFKERVDTAAFVLRREPEAAKREGQVGTYFRLVKERDADAKRLAFESGLAALRQGDDHHQVFNYQQSDFDAIPDKPWVYWITERVRNLFRGNPLLGDASKPRVGLQTGDNSRFLRYFWEIGFSKINFESSDLEQAIKGGSKWFPYNKGGSPVSWFSKQQNIVNWDADGGEIRCIGIESGKIASRAQNTDYYFRRGVTWSLIASRGFAARLSPGGWVFDVAGMTCFPSEAMIPGTLAVLNSRLGKFILSAINPTINYQVGDIERLPVPMERSSKIDDLVKQCVELARQDCGESEVTYEFIRPMLANGDRTARIDQLAALGAEIDDEVSRLYGLDDEDLIAIDRELNGPAASMDDDAREVDSDSGVEQVEATGDLTAADWAQTWISYALGTVLGRFEIGKPGGLGCGDFLETVVAEIRKLIDLDGIMACETGHPQDMAARAVACLELMLGAAEARERVRLATDSAGDPVDALRGWLDRFTGQPDKSFWKYHHQLYRKRPVYWPFQSPNKTFTVWVFHERFTKDTLFKIRQEFLDPRLNLLRFQLEEKRTEAREAAGKEKRAAEKAASAIAEQLEDVEEFSKRLNAILARGYTPCIDDGVLLNAAPLWELLPSWPETQKAWKELEDEKYEWAHQAMLHWPERVKTACQTNKSFAIAHGLA